MKRVGSFEYLFDQLVALCVDASAHVQLAHVDMSGKRVKILQQVSISQAGRKKGTIFLDVNLTFLCIDTRILLEKLVQGARAALHHARNDNSWIAKCTRVG